MFAQANNNTNNDSQGNNMFQGRTMDENIQLLGLGNISGNNDPKILYKTQLAQLKEMGYDDENKYIKLLLLCKGDLSKIFEIMEN